MPPRHGKSETVLAALAWAVKRWPDKLHAYVSYGQRFANLQSRKVRRAVEESGVKLADDSQAVHDWRTKQGGGMVATGVGGPLTGIGITGLLVVDDSLKGREAAESPIQRDALGEWFSDVVYTRLEPGSSCVVVGTRWHCLHPCAMVTTTMGTTAISQIKQGDTVITSAGLASVLAVASKHFSGDLVSIRTFGYPEPLLVTPEHRVLTDDGWLEAGKLKAGDWVRLSIGGESTTSEELRALVPDPLYVHSKAKPRARRISRTFTQQHCDRLSVAKKAEGRAKMEARVKPSLLQELISKGKTYDDIASVVGLPSKQSVCRFVQAFDIKRPSAKKIHGTPIIDHDFWRVVGYWLAEGTLTSGRKGRNNVVRFTFGSTEESLAIDIKRVMAKYGIAVHYKQRGSVLDVRFSSYQLANVFSKFGKGAHGKILPDWAVRLPESCAKELFRGYVDGDGCVGLTDNAWIRIASVSLPLLDGFRMLLCRLGIAGNVMANHTDPAGVVINGTKQGVSSGKRWELRVFTSDAPWMYTSGKASKVAPKDREHTSRDGRPGRKRTAHAFNGGLSVQIKSISLEPYDGLVYDIQTPSHDFSANGITVHNCDDLIGRLEAQGTPHWESINLPAIRDAKGKAADVGEPLWPGRFPLDALLAIRAQIGEYGWASLYQGHPIPKGGTLFREPVYYDVPELDGAQIWLACDPAGSEDTRADHTAAIAFALKDDIAFVLEVLRGQWETDLAAEKLLDFQIRHGFAKLHIESSRDGKAIAKSLKSIQPRLKIAGVVPLGDKFTRAQPVIAAWNAGRVRVPRSALWLRDFLFELEKFTGVADKSDDQVDALAHGWNAAHSPRNIAAESHYYE